MVMQVAKTDKSKRQHSKREEKAWAWVSTLIFPSNIRVSAYENGWMTRAELHKRLLTVWKEYDEHQLSILDQYRPNRTADTKSLHKALNDTDLAFILDNTLNDDNVNPDDDIDELDFFPEDDD